MGKSTQPTMPPGRTPWQGLGPGATQLPQYEKPAWMQQPYRGYQGAPAMQGRSYLQPPPQQSGGQMMPPQVPGGGGMVPGMMPPQAGGGQQYSTMPVAQPATPFKIDPIQGGASGGFMPAGGMQMLQPGQPNPLQQQMGLVNALRGV